MHVIRILLASALLLVSVLGCESGCNKQGTGVDWPKVATCAPRPSELIGTVQRILLAEGPAQTTIGDRAKNELESLATQNGPALVACLVDMVVREWSRPGASANPERMAGTARGRDFLNKIGTETHYPEPGSGNDDYSDPGTPPGTVPPATITSPKAEAPPAP
jgi:hypothetical protein